MHTLAPVTAQDTGQINFTSEFTANVGDGPLDLGGDLSRPQLPASQWSMYDGGLEGQERGESWGRKLNGGNMGIWP